ncbi:MAG: hypothetical protein IPJ03_20525 [Ignavibacteriales bacterium]|nr:hypothetical protein [Ignavibacteriales bacterium]
MKQIKSIFLIVILSNLMGCSVIYKNAIYDDFNINKPKNIGLLVTYKSILEVPTGHDFQFSEFSIYPDTVDQGSSLAYQSNSAPEYFISTSQIYTIFESILKTKMFIPFEIDESVISKPDTIKRVIEEIKAKYKNQIDAVLFVDFSPMFNKYFASKGVKNNNGYSCYYRYAVFDLLSGKILLRYKNVLHLDFYFKPNPSEDEMSKDILEIMISDLNANFPMCEK